MLRKPVYLLALNDSQGLGSTPCHIVLCSSVLLDGETEAIGGMISGWCESGTKPGWGGDLLPCLYSWDGSGRPGEEGRHQEPGGKAVKGWGRG